MSERTLNTLEAGRVARYHAAPTVAPQTVGLHSWGVAVICLYLTSGDSMEHHNLLARALLHDAAELYTGDVPFTTKRGCPEIKELLTRLEKIAYEQWLIPLPEVTDYDECILKMADTIDGLLWCRKTEHPDGPVGQRWNDSLTVAFKKFQPVVGDDVVQRALNLVTQLESFPA